MEESNDFTKFYSNTPYYRHLYTVEYPPGTLVKDATGSAFKLNDVLTVLGPARTFIEDLPMFRVQGPDGKVRELSIGHIEKVKNGHYRLRQPALIARESVKVKRRELPKIEGGRRKSQRKRTYKNKSRRNRKMK